MSLSITRLSGCRVVLNFSGEVGLDGIDEDEFFATAAFVVEPAPFELAVFAEVVDFLDATGDEGGGFGDADPGGGSLHAEADFAVDWGGKHFEEPLLLKDGRRGSGGPPVSGWLAGAAHRGDRDADGGGWRFIIRALGLRRL